MSVLEYEAERFAGAVKNGGTLISVRSESSEEVSRAKDSLKATGAHDIASSSEAGSQNAARDRDRVLEEDEVTTR